MSIENLHIEIQFSYSFCSQTGRVVKAIDWKSIGLFTRGFKTHFRLFFNWFYGVMDSNLQFEFSNPSSNLEKIGILKTSAATFFENLEKKI